MYRILLNCVSYHVILYIVSYNIMYRVSPPSETGADRGRAGRTQIRIHNMLCKCYIVCYTLYRSIISYHTTILSHIIAAPRSRRQLRAGRRGRGAEEGDAEVDGGGGRRGAARPLQRRQAPARASVARVARLCCGFFFVCVCRQTEVGACVRRGGCVRARV